MAEIRQFGFDVVDRKKHHDDDDAWESDPYEPDIDDDGEDEPTEDDGFIRGYNGCSDCEARGAECPYGPDSEYR
jgi:hypothetical protein